MPARAAPNFHTDDVITDPTAIPETEDDAKEYEKELQAVGGDWPKAEPLARSLSQSDHATREARAMAYSALGNALENTGRADEAIDLRVIRLDPRNDVADGFVDERQPNFLGSCHVDRIGQDSRCRARHAICAATRTSNPAKRRRRVASGSDTARATPPWAAAAAAIPSTAAACQRTLP